MTSRKGRPQILLIKYIIANFLYLLLLLYAIIFLIERELKMFNKSYSFLDKCYKDNFFENKDTLFETKETIFFNYLKEKENPNIVFKYIYKNNDTVGYYVLNKQIEERLKPYIDYLITDAYVVPEERGRGFAFNNFKNILKTKNVSLGFIIEDECLKGKKLVSKLAKELNIKMRKSSDQYPDNSSTKLYILDAKQRN